MRFLGMFRKSRRIDFESMDDAGLNDERSRLWNWATHEDDLLTTRVSVFLLAESILIAVTATVVNTFAGLHSARHIVRIEVFALAIALDLAGLVLTLIFWYILTLNYRGLKVLVGRLKDLDKMYADLDKARREDRSKYLYFRTVFHKTGANDTINNVLPLTILAIWCIVGAFAVAIFVSQ
jgi:hypothetical protein